MNIGRILWDEESVYHILKHGITPSEVEEAVFNGQSLVLKGREGRYVLLSRTSAGRYITVVLVFKLKGRVKVITAREMDHKERKYYQKRVK